MGYSLIVMFLSIDMNTLQAKIAAIQTVEIILLAPVCNRCVRMARITNYECSEDKISCSYIYLFVILFLPMYFSDSARLSGV